MSGFPSPFTSAVSNDMVPSPTIVNDGTVLKASLPLFRYTFRMKGQVGSPYLSVCPNSASTASARPSPFTSTSSSSTTFDSANCGCVVVKVPSPLFSNKKDEVKSKGETPGNTTMSGFPSPLTSPTPNSPSVGKKEG